MELPAENLSFPRGSSAKPRDNSAAAEPAAALVPPPVSAAPKALPIRAFADGFLGGVVGGIAYSYAPAWLRFQELPFAGATILVLAIILGVFEVWRVARLRSPALVRARLLVVLVVCVAILLTVSALSKSLSTPASEESIPVRIAPRATLLCESNGASLGRSAVVFQRSKTAISGVAAPSDIFPGYAKLPHHRIQGSAMQT